MSSESEVHERLARIRAQQGLRGSTQATPGGMFLEKDWLPPHMKKQREQEEAEAAAAALREQQRRNRFKHAAHGARWMGAGSNRQEEETFVEAPSKDPPPAWFQNQQQARSQQVHFQQRQQSGEDFMMMMPFLMNSGAESQAVEQQIQAEQERSRKLLKMLVQIKESEEQEALLEDEEQARYQLEHLAAVLKRTKQEKEEKRRRDMEERQMKNMEMLVAAVAANHAARGPFLPPMQQPSNTGAPYHPTQPYAPRDAPRLPRLDLNAHAPPHRHRRAHPQEAGAPPPQSAGHTQAAPPQPVAAAGAGPASKKAKKDAKAAAKKKKKQLEEMTFDELILEKGEQLEVKSFLDFSADEVSEEEKLKLKKELEKKRKDKEEKARILSLQGQLKPYYRHVKDALREDVPFAEPDAAAVMKGKIFLRMMAYSVIAMLKLKHLEQATDFRNRIEKETGELGIRKDLFSFRDLTKGYLSRTVKKPMQSILEDRKMQMDIKAERGGISLMKRFRKKSADTGDKAMKSRMLKLKVRVKGILKALVERATEEGGVSVQIMNYLRASFFNPRVNWPPNFLFKSERTYFDVRDSETVRMPKLKADDANDQQMLLQFRKYASRMVLGLMIHRVLIPTIVLKPQECGLGRAVNSLAKKNCLLVASVLYALLGRLYPSGETKVVSETENMQIIGMPPGAYKGEKGFLARGNDRDDSSNDSSKTDKKKETAGEGAENKPDDKTKSEKQEEHNSIDTKGTPIPWTIKPNSDTSTGEELINIRMLYSSREQFQAEKLRSYNRQWVQLYSSGMAIFSESKEFQAFEKFSPYTTVTLITEDGVADSNFSDPQYELPYVYVRVVFLQTELDEIGDGSASSAFFFCKNRYECASVYTQISQAFRAWHPSIELDTPPDENEIASMVYPWKRWSESDAYKHIGDAWMDEQAQQLKQWGDIVVDKLILEMTGQDTGPAPVSKKKTIDTPRM